MSPCGVDVETTEHFPLRCLCFFTQRSELFEKVAYLLYRSTSNSSSLGKDVIKLVIKFLKSADRFNKPLISEQ